MKRKFLIVVATLALSLCILPACNLDTADFASSSIKSITQPYIAQYECKEARFGNLDLLNSYDYIKIVFLNKSDMELIFKPKSGEKKSYEGKYKVDTETRELEGEIGVLGHKFKEKVKVEKGEFVISKIILQKELYIRFQMN